ncbi:MAG: FecR family protein [Carboxylicivirga sp.]|jgi:ferric-dicitrate binding protein FerR (iron transport regulator)|nr:FecR family protein [Carboxylicivirga sp.]MCT4645079.1 FecR family protein [Carboxylicivirga sp.]
MKDLMANIILGKASDNEKLVFYKQIETDDKLRKDFIWCRNLYIAHSSKRYVRLSSSKKDDFKKIKYRLLKRKTFKLIKLGISYAAVFIIAIMLVHLFGVSSIDNPNGEFSSIITQSQSTNQIFLADGSTILLNANSKIELVSQNKNEIVLNLEGEALFDVIHNEERRFIVKAGGLEIIDKGTKFNIKANVISGLVKASLIEGKINIIAGNDTYSLKPGEEFMYQNNKHKLRLFNPDESQFGIWGGKFVFRNAKLADIAEELEQWYGVSIEFANGDLKSKSFSGTLDRNVSLEDILNMINYTTGIKYNIYKKKGYTYVTIKK